MWRYVSASHRKFEESPVTEDDINEVKGEISTMRYELLEVLEKNGMNVSSADRKEKSKFAIYFHKAFKLKLKLWTIEKLSRSF